MKHQFDKEACPACGSEDYTIEDYDEDFYGEEDGAQQRWTCRCDKCGYLFDIKRYYDLVNVSVTRSERSYWDE